MFKRLIYRLTQIMAGRIFKVLVLISYITFGLLFFRIKVKNKEVLRGLRGPMIITPNHKSYADHFFILACLTIFSKLLPVRAMAAGWLFGVPSVGWALKNLFGAYRIKKGHGLAVSLREPLKVLAKGGAMAIYPEGGIRFRPGVHEVKIGAAYLAQKSGVPILPVAIKGIEFLSWKAFFFGRRKVEVIFGKPFLVDRTKDLAEISEEIRLKIKELYDLS